MKVEEKIMRFLAVFGDRFGSKEMRWVLKLRDIHREAANI